MILDSLVLHNFGIYKGRQALELTPASPNRPIILFGGLNGGGKTTIADAIQLALFGKLARCSNRGSLPYDEFLQRSIHRKVKVSEGAAVELVFRYLADGKEQQFHVHRSWLNYGKGIREKCEVLVNGEYSRQATETWNEKMEEFLPVRISHLFFFDGEQIEKFVDPETSASLLSVAIHSLLGLDLLDRLSTDLVALERRKQAKVISGRDKEQAEEYSQRNNRLEMRRAELTQSRASYQNDLDYTLKRLTEIEQKFNAEGGELYENRTVLENERDRINNTLEELRIPLNEIAYGDAPLLLVRAEISDILMQSERESAHAHAIALIEIVEKRDAVLLLKLKEFEVKGHSINAIKSFLQEDRAVRFPLEITDTYLSLDEGTARRLASVVSVELDNTAKQIGDLVERYEKAKLKQEELERLLASVPAEDAIARILTEREELKKMAAGTREKILEIDAAIATIASELKFVGERMASTLGRVAEGKIYDQKVRRILRESPRARGTIVEFRKAVLARHAAQLEEYILKSFLELLKKHSLVERIIIDRNSFGVQLFGKDGILRTPDRLSAGERQLLALSILWGLARASGRRLPVVIDTPLGRLDSQHRIHLVERYFPVASHQVILLSTDEEIDRRYYKSLQPSIGREYYLDFNDDEESTEINKGYFWSKER